MKNLFFTFCIFTACLFFTACDNSNQIQSKDEKKLEKMSYRELGKKADNAMKRGQKIRAKLFLKEMLKRQIKVKNPKASEIGTLYYLLGQITQNKNYFLKATPYIEKALSQEQSKAIPSKREIISACYMLGRIALASQKK